MTAFFCVRCVIYHFAKDNAAEAIFAKIFGFGTIIVYKYTNNFFFKVVYFRRNGARRDARPFFLYQVWNCGTIFDVNIARIHLFFIVDFGQERGAQGCAPVRFFLYAKTAFL